MFDLLLLAAGIATASAAEGHLAEAQHALEAGRLGQARTMIAAAVVAGSSGPQVDRLLAELALASGRSDEALVRYRELLKSQPDDPRLLERAATAALGAGQVSEASALAARAVVQPGATWRAWNVRGVAADRSGEWATADQAYRRGLELAPDKAELLNNQGWSRLLQGRWDDALAFFQQAAARGSSEPRVRNNLQLAQMALAADLPERQSGESFDEWSARLNDAGVAARATGDRAKAVAAFSRAIEARGSWYARAANNLASLGTQP